MCVCVYVNVYVCVYLYVCVSVCPCVPMCQLFMRTLNANPHHSLHEALGSILPESVMETLQISEFWT